MDAEFGQRHLRLARLAKQEQHVAHDVAQQPLRIAGGDGGRDHLAVAVHGQAAGRQLLDRAHDS